LFKETKALVGMSAFFYAAGGNDPSRWFFAVEGVKPVYDDTPDYIHGMRVDEPDYEDECDLSDEELGMPYKDAISHIKPSEITQVDEHTVQLTGQALLDYLAFRFPKETAEVKLESESEMVKCEAVALAAELDEFAYEYQRQAREDYGSLSAEEEAEHDMEIALSQAEAEAELYAEQEVLDDIKRDEVIAFEQFHADWCEAIEMEAAEEGAMSALAQHEAEVDVVVEASVAVTWLLVRYNFLFAEGNQTWADWAQLRHDLVMAKHTLESNNDYELSNTIEEKLGNIKFIINDIETKTLLLELEEQR